ncbi:hypothetical protein, partial [Streptomyces capuensis]|uniref:hypothetical protein n=1 Tax=Streptomyces capuensis TaxID=1464056 RepID=UPI000518A805
TLPGCRRLSEVCAALARAGMVADEVTVRVAVWWLGYSMGRLPRADSGDQRRVRVRLREDYTDLIRRLMKAGLRYVDIAAYLDVSHADVTNAMQDLARAEAGSAA